MALGATIYKTELDISDIDRNYYAGRTLTVARHPSETEGRMMLRILAYALNGSDTIRFAEGLSKEGEPALMDTDDTGWTSLWIELGTPTVKQLRKAAGKSSRVTVYAYGDDRVGVWWQSARADLEKIEKLTVRTVSDETFEALASLCSRHMRLSVTIQDGMALVSSSDGRNVEVTPGVLKQGL